MQFKKILAYALTVCLLVSVTVVSAYAVDDDVPFDESLLSEPIYYTDGYYPGVVSEARSSGVFANPIAHGSYSELNYNPLWFYNSGSSTYPSSDFNALTPSVTADQTDVSGIYYIPNTTFLRGSLLAFRLPSTDDCYFDFQSSNFIFDQQSPQANTFYINGDLTFSLRNLWSFNGSNGDGVALTDSWYLASDPLAVQLVIDGKAYGDIIDVTSYTSPFTALYNGGVPSNATVTFDNLKVYYQGDTPDMIGFRVYTGSAFTDGQYNYNNAGQFIAVDVTNSVTFRCSEIPDITFVQESTDSDYTGDLSGILDAVTEGNALQRTANSLLTTINTAITGLYRAFYTTGATDFLYQSGSVLNTESQLSLTYLVRHGFLGLRSLLTNVNGQEWGQVLYNALLIDAGVNVLNPDGKLSALTAATSISGVLRRGLLGLSANITALDTSVNASLDDLDKSLTDTLTDFETSVDVSVDDLDKSLTDTLTGFETTVDKSLDDLFTFGSGTTYLGPDGNVVTTTDVTNYSHVLRRGLLGLSVMLRDFLRMPATTQYLSYDGNVIVADVPIEMQDMIRRGLMGLATLEKTAQSYVADTVFKWQSYNMDTHNLNTATNVTGQNNLFFTAFQSMEDKLGRLAYVFGSDEDLALKAESEPAMDAIRENFGSGPSLSDIADVAEVTTVLPNMFDTRIGISDGFEFISDEKDSILSWFTYDTLYALDSTSLNRSSVSADVNLDTYNSNMDKVNKYRNLGDTDD